MKDEARDACAAIETQFIGIAKSADEISVFCDSANATKTQAPRCDVIEIALAYPVNGDRKYVACAAKFFWAKRVAKGSRGSESIKNRRISAK
ncbi:MAG TPA: hypothetical protein VG986_17880 [Pseudolabrys sp.]|nr:hypothetical protein [Pseudolabrys sp.]